MITETRRFPQSFIQNLSFDGKIMQKKVRPTMIHSTLTSSGHYTSLRKLFEETINVSHISEQLISFDSKESINTIHDYMISSGYDVVGIKVEGIMEGYIEKGQMNLTYFKPADLVSNTTPLIQVLNLFRDKNRLFILEGNTITNLVTMADLQKPPVRMLLFGIISLMEMHLLHLVKSFYPGNSWEEKISENRLLETKKLYGSRKERNEEISLMDCLQLSDKKTLIVKHKELRGLLQFDSRAQGEKFFDEIVSLRNKLAHAQDIVTGTTWRNIIDLIEQSEQLLKICESYQLKD